MIVINKMLQGMPRRISDYPDAFAGWNLISSLGSLVSVVATWLFLYILYDQLVNGKATSRYPWLTPQFYIDSLQALLSRAYSSLEWGVNSPPKPHAFVSLPAQSSFFYLNKSKLIFNSKLAILGCTRGFSNTSSLSSSEPNGIVDRNTLLYNQSSRYDNVDALVNRINTSTSPAEVRALRDHAVDTKEMFSNLNHQDDVTTRREFHADTVFEVSTDRLEQMEADANANPDDNNNDNGGPDTNNNNPDNYDNAGSNGLGSGSANSNGISSSSNHVEAASSHSQDNLSLNIIDYLVEKLQLVQMDIFDPEIILYLISLLF